MKAEKNKKTGKLSIKVKKGALHKEMGISEDKKIPAKALNKELKEAKKEGDVKTEKRVIFAKNFGHK